MGLYTLTLKGIENQLLDAARSDHTVAGSIGELFQEFMDQAIQSGHTTESAMDILRRVSGEATGGATSDSLMHRIENAASAPTAAVVADAVWDEARADHTTAATAGEFLQEMMDEAIVSDNTTESGLDIIRRISAETMGTVTANSLMAKFTGMTDAQVVATTDGLSVTFDNALFTMTASQTVTIIPATGEADSGMIVGNASMQTGDRMGISPDSGTTFINLNDPSNSFTMLTANGTPAYVDWVGNSTGRYRFTTSATVATRSIARHITTLS